MHSVTAYVARDPLSCYRAFIDVPALTAWVPGLRRAQTIAMAQGNAGEVHFEYASSLTYTLVYTYDLENREVRWQPKLGKRDGVSGFARFEPFDNGTRVTYGIEDGPNRPPTDSQALVDAFVGFVGKR